MGAYRRVIVKLSGEALGEHGRLFDHGRFEAVAQVLAQIARDGTQLGVVIGGGNLWRGRSAAPDMRVATADQIGMLGTVMNALYMRDMLQNAGARARVMSAVEMPRFVETYNPQTAREQLDNGCTLLYAGGTGNPCFSTDSGVTLRALETECDAILMAKNIDGVYTADPATDKSATLIRDVSYAEAARRGLRAIDPAAFHMLNDYRFPALRIFALDPPDNLLRVLAGDPMGTTLHP